MELFQAHLHLLLGIITTLDKAGLNLYIIRRREGHVVDLSSLRVSASTNDALDEDFIRNIQEQEAVGRNSSVGKCFSLGWSARESIKKPSFLAAI